MSDYNPFQNSRREDGAEELSELLERLERRDEARRYPQNSYAVTEADQPELITVEDPDPLDPEEHMYLTIDRFQPTGMSEDNLQELLIGGEEEAADDEQQTDAPRKRVNPFKALWAGFKSNIPTKEDSRGTKVRKCGFLTSLGVMLLAIIYLAVDLLILPASRQALKDRLNAMYDENKATVVVSPADGNYPRHMLASFMPWYDINPDVRGRIVYSSTGDDFLKIKYPIVYRDVDDNSNPYLTTNFEGGYDAGGTLYFDQSNKLESRSDYNRILIVYGHNMKGGEMFAGLNKFLNGVGYARAAPTLEMTTLYRRDFFKVFAVVMIDEDDIPQRKYDMWKTNLSDTEFMNHVNEIRKRSVYDYPVDVAVDDQLLVLSTCTGRVSAGLNDGRLLVVARRVRDGESTGVNTKQIKKNDDVIMPYTWYVNSGLEPHEFYDGKGGVVTPGIPNNSTTSTTPSGTTATTPSGSATGTDDTTVTTGTTTGTTTTTRPTMPPTEPADPTCEHDYVEDTEARREPNCGAPGMKTEICSKCQHVRYEEIPATGKHAYDNDCDAECNVCMSLREVSHDYGEDGVCTKCQQTKPTESTTTTTESTTTTTTTESTTESTEATTTTTESSTTTTESTAATTTTTESTTTTTTESTTTE